MSFLEIILIAFGLASDAFAVSVCSGTAGTTQDKRSMIRLSFHFGLFQFLMPILGWLAGLSVVNYVESFDHWIAFGLLLWVGIKMIRSTQNGVETLRQRDPSKGVMLIILSIATSIDALAIGLNLAMLQVSIWYPAIIIGVVTGITSFLGILLGKSVSDKFGRHATYFGGGLLILIGFRILIGHILYF